MTDADDIQLLRAMKERLEALSADTVTRHPVAPTVRLGDYTAALSTAELAAVLRLLARLHQRVSALEAV